MRGARCLAKHVAHIMKYSAAQTIARFGWADDVVVG